MAAAMRDLFPSRLARRTTKGDASSDHYQGLRRALPHLRHFVRGHLADLGFIDPARLQRVMARTSVGLDDDLSSIESAIAVEAWLRANETVPAPQWQSVVKAVAE